MLQVGALKWGLFNVDNVTGARFAKPHLKLLVFGK